ncbi:MAG: DsrE family protein [bacterium]
MRNNKVQKSNKSMSSLILSLSSLAVIFILFNLTAVINANTAFGKNIQALPYFKHHDLKELYQVPANPKMWGLLVSNASNNVKFSDQHFINYKIVIVAYGPAIKFFMKKYDKKYYAMLQSLHAYGVKLVACHTTMVGLHIKKSDLFPFVDVVYPGAIFYIVQKEQQGYAYIKP